MIFDTTKSIRIILILFDSLTKIERNDIYFQYLTSSIKSTYQIDITCKLP